MNILHATLGPWYDILYSTYLVLEFLNYGVYMSLIVQTIGGIYQACSCVIFLPSFIWFLFNFFFFINAFKFTL